MYRVMQSQAEIFGMTNLNPQSAGLSVGIWSQHGGKFDNLHHNVPRVKIGTREYSESISIEPSPKILSKSGNIKQSEQKKLNEAIDYVGRNHDLFLKHFEDSAYDFDDMCLYKALADRGEYKL